MKEDELITYLDRYHEDCFQWAMTCCDQNREQARDLLHSIYLKILEGKAVFRHQSSFKTWMFSIIRNRSIDQHRMRQRRRNRGMYLNLPDVEKGPEADMIQGESHMILRQALTMLSDKQNQVLHLIYFDELTVKEAAELMQISVSTARTHLERAKKHLKTYMTTNLPIE